MNSDCICNDIYHAAHDRCESSTRYLCLQLANLAAPKFTLNGKEVSRELATATIKTVLSGAKYPLISGLNVLGASALRQAIAIAKQYRAVIDSGLERVPSLSSLVREGNVTATLGEIALRTDRLLLINCDPAKTHPRLYKTILCRERQVEIGCLGGASANDLPLAIKIETLEIESDLMLLQSAVLGTPVRQDVSRDKINSIQMLLDWLRSGTFASVLTDGLSDSCLDTVTSICKALNRQIRIVSLNLRSDANGVGAESALAAATGYPAAVDFCSGHAQSFGAEFCTKNVLERHEADALLVFDPRLIANSPDIPAIVFGSEDGESPRAGDSNQLLLRIENLSSLGDDFHRIDHLSFDVAARGSETDSIGSFLGSFVGDDI